MIVQIYHICNISIYNFEKKKNIEGRKEHTNGLSYESLDTGMTPRDIQSDVTELSAPLRAGNML